MDSRRFVAALLATLCVAACGDAPSEPPAAETAAAPVAERRNILDTETKRYSQFDEELIVRDFFQDRRDGVFLDVGCGPPTERSTTYYLEKHLGWSGIGIDALPDYAEPWKQERPKSRFFAFLVTDHSDTMDAFYRSPIEGLSSTQQSRPFQAPDTEPLVLEGKEMQLPTITLDKLLDEAGVESIDFLSMDIEGSEPPALAGFDIERFAPELVCIEVSGETEEAIRDYFAEHGYERIERYTNRDPANWYFTPK